MAYKPKKQTEIPTRDARGVRINNYNDTMKNFKEKNNDGTPDMTKVLIDTFKRNISNTITTETGAEVVRGAGRPRKYPTIESFENAVNEYIQYINDTYENTGVDLIPDIEGLCAFIGISRDTLNTWEYERDKAYSDYIKNVKNEIAAYKKQLGLKGKIPPIVLAMDFNNNHGYIQQNTLEVRHKTVLEELPTVDNIRDRIPTKNPDNDIIDI